MALEDEEGFEADDQNESYKLQKFAKCLKGEDKSKKGAFRGEYGILTYKVEGIPTL